MVGGEEVGGDQLFSQKIVTFVILSEFHIKIIKKCYCHYHNRSSPFYTPHYTYWLFITTKRTPIEAKITKIIMYYVK